MMQQIWGLGGTRAAFAYANDMPIESVPFGT